MPNDLKKVLRDYWAPLGFLATLLVGFGAASAKFADHGARIEAVEARQSIDRDGIAEIKADVKVLLERTKPKP